MYRGRVHTKAKTKIIGNVQGTRAYKGKNKNNREWTEDESIQRQKQKKWGMYRGRDHTKPKTKIIGKVQGTRSYKDKNKNNRECTGDESIQRQK